MMKLLENKENAKPLLTCNNAKLVTFVQQTTSRTERNLGAIDAVFYGVNLKRTVLADELKALIADYDAPSELDFFDGLNHPLSQVIDWAEDSEIAVTIMALGDLLGIWTLHTPKSYLGRNDIPESTEAQMVDQGFFYVKVDS